MSRVTKAKLTLKQARARRLFTIRALAAAAGVVPSTIYEIEHHRTRPRFGTIRAISDALGVEPMQIVEFAQAIEEGGGQPATKATQHEGP